MMIGIKIVYEKKLYVIYISKGVKILVTDNMENKNFEDVRILNVGEIIKLNKDQESIEVKRSKNFFDFYINLIIKKILKDFK